MKLISNKSMTDIHLDPKSLNLAHQEALARIEIKM